MMSVLHKRQVCIPTDVARLHNKRLIHDRHEPEIDCLYGRPDGNINEVGLEELATQLFADIGDGGAFHGRRRDEKEREVEGIEDHRVGKQLDCNDLPQAETALDCASIA